MKDWVLITWLICTLVWDTIVWSGWVYLVWWKGASSWWCVLCILMTCSSTLFEALRKHYGLPKGG